MVSGLQLNNLFACSIAIVYEQQAKYTEALSMHHEVLEIRLKTFGPEHPDTASTYNNIGVVYDEMGEHEKALEFYNKNLDIDIKVHGPDHPAVAKTKVHPSACISRLPLCCLFVARFEKM